MQEDFYSRLDQAWKCNNSLLCIGLDTDLAKVPEKFHVSDAPVFEFNRAVIDATADLVCGYKPQIAHYSAHGREAELIQTINYIKTKYPQLIVILDAKRGDIGSTADYYCQEAFERFRADAVTLNPYLGSDSLAPYLTYRDKGCIILCRTSNSGAADFQELLINDKELYLHVAEKAQSEWNDNRNVMLVVGATSPGALRVVRQAAPDVPFLVPGIGAQGGNVNESVSAGSFGNGLGLVVSASRSIIYAGGGDRRAIRDAAIDLANALRAASTAFEV